MPLTGGRGGGTHSYGSRGLQNPNNVSLMSSPHTPATGNTRMATGMRGPKPAMPSPSVPYQVGTIWGNVRKCYGCKQHFLPATPPDDHYILVRPEADWYWEKQNMQWRLGRKSNRYYHMSPHCIRRNFPRFSFAHVVVPAELPKPIKDILQYRFTQSC